MKRISFFLVFAIAATSLVAQKAMERERAYNKRIQKEQLNGIYIPKDLPDAFSELNKLTSREARSKFLQMGEGDAMVKLHFSLGRWMRENWSLWEGSRLSVYMNKMGATHPEMMSRVIVVAYHRYLTKTDLDLKTLISQVEQYVEKKRAQELKEFEPYRKD